MIAPTAQGNLLLYRDGIQAPATSTVNFTSGSIRSNNAIVEIGNGGVNARANLAGGSGQVHITLDVTGYFQ